MLLMLFVLDTASVSVAERMQRFEQPTTKKCQKTAPPPKPPLSTKPTIPPKPSVSTSTQSPTAPVAPPRPAITKPKDEHLNGKPQKNAADVYISPVAAPLDPALDTGGSETRIRRRENRRQKDEARDAEILAELQAICTDADPTKLYRNMVRIGQG